METPGPGSVGAEEAPCPDNVASGFTCVRLTVPLDHVGAGEAIARVEVAVRRHTAPGPARGTLVMLVGEPGEGGIANATRMTDALGTTIRTRWDLAFVDPRGVGRSGPLRCPEAAAAWQATDRTAAGVGTATPTGTEADLLAAAARFSQDCVAESGADPASLRFLGSRDTAADLESLRLYLGAETWTLWGEGEGSLIAQAYAAQYPERMAALILDAPLDPASTALERRHEMARALEQTLAATLLSCTTEVTCTRDVSGGDALAAYDALAAQLSAGPVTVSVPDQAGQPRDRTFRQTDLATVAAAYLGDETDRQLLQRAIAAASQGQWWHLARMLAIVERSAGAASAQVGLACADQPLLPGSGDPAAEWLRLARERGVAATRLGSTVAADLPCATWPADPDPARPAPVVADAAYPVIVMGATLDPVTPWANGERIAARAGDRTSTIVTAGGPHVTYGRGRSCPDRHIRQLLIVGDAPPARATCDGDIVDGYAPLAPARRNQVNGTRAAILGADRELVNAPDLRAWDGRGELRIGCPFGGWVAWSGSRGGDLDLRLERCAWTEGLPLTGTGSMPRDGRSMRLELASGQPGRTVTYNRTGRGQPNVSGSLTILE